jgi:transcriptional regulator with GAF, ATPase, and Fis domain
MIEHRPAPTSQLAAFDLKKKVLRLEALYDASRSVATARDEAVLLDEVLSRTVPVLDAGGGFCAVFEDRGQSGHATSVGMHATPTMVSILSDPFVLDVCRVTEPLRRGETVVLGQDVKSAAGVVLRSAGGEALGVLSVFDRESRGGGATSFDGEDLRFLASVAALVSPALAAMRQLRALSDDVDRLREENRALKSSLQAGDLLVGDSAPMRRVKEMISRAAASRASVLIRGESGTGKELAAKLLHAGSTRWDGPFIAINCAAVPESLLESELFGIERGVATGVDHRLGKFELASGGTIFLDEIGDAPLAIQAKLLRVLQERVVERLGGRQTIPVDVRVIAATHADLLAEIGQRKFREDLFFRLRVVEVHLPPLRDRKEDIPRLAAHFLARIAEREGRRLSLTRAAVAELLRYPFPGNVRELENLLEGSAALVPADVIDAGDLQFSLARVSSNTSGSQDLASMEREHIRQVLVSVGGNKSRAARMLGINRRTLYRKNVT